jgi:ribose transport system substrate-binding protein
LRAACNVITPNLTALSFAPNNRAREKTTKLTLISKICRLGACAVQTVFALPMQSALQGGSSMKPNATLSRAAIALALSLLAIGSAAFAAGPQVVSGPSADPTCYAPWSADTKFFKFPEKKGPYRVALANGYIANTWRIQMIQTAKAYAAQPEVAAKIKEFKVVSTGEDVAAQISAINNFIDSGFDAIVVNAQNPKAFAPVIKRAKDAGVVLVAFDNILDTQDAINVNVDQKGLGVLWANWLIKHVPDGGKILEVRGVAGTSVDTDRHNGIEETLKASGKKWNVVEVVGKWDDATAQKATADAIAVQKRFDGITAQGGDTGVVQAMIDAGHPFVPFGGETENGFRKFCAADAAKGLKCSSAGTGPAQVAVAIKTAIDALQGKVVPQSIRLPLAVAEDPNFKDGQDFYSKESDNFFVGNSFPTCGINFSAQEIMGQSKADK